ncbi:MAG: glycosyltransferase [Nitrospiraceae bacterium]|nr:glycosyltransferase [Nitrospiraceae bacterium]
MDIRTDCKFFKGDAPCRPHKDEKVHCDTCSHYAARKQKLLIIKLGSADDVIRTTPLLRKLRQEHPGAEISWLTNYPEALPPDVDRVYRFDLKDILTLLATPFDVLYSLDKDGEVCGLANLIRADVKKGFHLNAGKCSPLDEAATHTWLTGIFDDISKANRKSYQEQIFEICGFQFNKEPYILNNANPHGIGGNLKKKSILIGLNTGCGSRWKTRLWPEAYWTELAKKLADADREVVLLGGPEEDEKNRGIAKAAGCIYPGCSDMGYVTSIVEQCDLVVTGAATALHTALGLGKKIVLMNNIFNKYEFELYGLGVVIEPEVDCLCCYRASCEKDCMRLITPDMICRACNDLLSYHWLSLPKRRESLSIIFPAFNEEANIENTLNQTLHTMQRITDNWEIIVVDDGSSDRTPDIVKKYNALNSNIKVIRHPQNKGYGAALKSGIISAKSDLVFFCDSDLQFDIREIGKLLRWIDDYEIVVGYRIKRQDPFHRRLNAFGWNILIRLLLDLRIKDIDCAFKLFRREVFENIRIDAVGAMVNTDILAQAVKNTFRIKEVPVTHYPRLRGKQSGARLKVIAKAFRELLVLYNKLQEHRKHPRVNVRLRYKFQDGNDPWREDLVNISDGGMGLITDASYRPEDTVRLDFDYGRASHVSVLGKVVRASNSGQGYQLGIKFTCTGENFRKALREIISSNIDSRAERERQKPVLLP